MCSSDSVSVRRGGLSGSGKSTLASAVAARLLELERAAYVLDGDNVRHGLNSDLRFSAPIEPRTSGGSARWRR